LELFVTNVDCRRLSQYEGARVKDKNFERGLLGGKVRGKGIRRVVANLGNSVQNGRVSSWELRKKWGNQNLRKVLLCSLQTNFSRYDLTETGLNYGKGWGGGKGIKNSHV